MTPHFPAPVDTGALTAAGRTISEVGPYVGATSFTVGSGLVFVSADGTWGRTRA